MGFDFYDLFQISELKAIGLAIDPTLDSIWSLKCREYSEKFHTPLHVVINELDPVFVLDQLNQDKYHPSVATNELEELLDKLYKIKDPSYSKMSKQEIEDLVDAVLNKEIKRSQSKKAPTPESIEAEIKKSESRTPKSGSMNFSDLEKIESEPNTGFKD